MKRNHYITTWFVAGAIAFWLGLFIPSVVLFLLGITILAVEVIYPKG